MSATLTLGKWDTRFVGLAEAVASWSRDPSTRTGAALVSPDRTDVILGYNGFPRRMIDSPQRYADRDEKYSRVIHCEMNCLLNAKRPVAGYTLYTVPFLSCDRCAVHVIQAGIVRAVAPLPSADVQGRWGDALAKTRAYYAEAGIEVCEFDLLTGRYAVEH